MANATRASNPSKLAGFSLVELLLVSSVVAMLFVAVFVVYPEVRDGNAAGRLEPLLQRVREGRAPRDWEKRLKSNLGLDVSVLSREPQSLAVSIRASSKVCFIASMDLLEKGWEITINNRSVSGHVDPNMLAAACAEQRHGSLQYLVAHAPSVSLAASPQQSSDVVAPSDLAWQGVGGF